MCVHFVLKLLEKELSFCLYIRIVLSKKIKSRLRSEVEIFFSVRTFNWIFASSQAGIGHRVSEMSTKSLLIVESISYRKNFNEMIKVQSFSLGPKFHRSPASSQAGFGHRVGETSTKSLLIATTISSRRNIDEVTQNFASQFSTSQNVSR